MNTFRVYGDTSMSPVFKLAILFGLCMHCLASLSVRADGFPAAPFPTSAFMVPQFAPNTMPSQPPTVTVPVRAAVPDPSGNGGTVPLNDFSAYIQLESGTSPAVYAMTTTGLAHVPLMALSTGTYKVGAHGTYLGVLYDTLGPAQGTVTLDSQGQLTPNGTIDLVLEPSPMNQQVIKGRFLTQTSPRGSCTKTGWIKFLVISGSNTSSVQADTTPGSNPNQPTEYQLGPVSTSACQDPTIQCKLEAELVWTCRSPIGSSQTIVTRYHGLESLVLGPPGSSTIWQDIPLN